MHPTLELRTTNEISYKAALVQVSKPTHPSSSNQLNDSKLSKDIDELKQLPLPAPQTPATSSLTYPSLTTSSMSSNRPYPPSKLTSKRNRTTSRSRSSSTSSPPDRQIVQHSGPSSLLRQNSSPPSNRPLQSQKHAYATAKDLPLKPSKDINNTTTTTTSSSTTSNNNNNKPSKTTSSATVTSRHPGLQPHQPTADTHLHIAFDSRRSCAYSRVCPPSSSTEHIVTSSPAQSTYLPRGPSSVEASTGP